MADYFVKVDDGKELRRQLLESSKLSIHLLKQEFSIKEIRARKLQLIESARKDLKEITFLIGRLEKDLPVLTKKELEEIDPKAFKRPTAKKAKKGKAKKTAKNQPQPEPVPQKTKESEHLSKLERLERSLKMVEGRLNEL